MGPLNRALSYLLYRPTRNWNSGTGEKFSEDMGPTGEVGFYCFIVFCLGSLSFSFY
jgi:hypothetical protein